MSSGTRERSALRCHGVAVGLLALQLMLGWSGLPLAWAGALLLALVVLKLLEGRQRHDRQHAVLAEGVVLGVLAVLQPGLGSSLLQLLTGVVLLAAVLLQEADAGSSLGQTLRRSLQLSLAALPLLLVLFLLLPRFGPLWQAPSSALAGTGLNPDLSPGMLGQLVQDSSPALRITWLHGQPPAMAERYWRVLTLDQFDGQRWWREPERPAAQAPPQRTLTAPLEPEQIWVAEPSPLTALPWPGLGQPSPDAVRIQSDGVLLGPWPAASRRRYGLASQAASGAWRHRPPAPQDLALPRGQNPKLEAIGRAWAAHLSPPERVVAARRWIQQQHLEYTLHPPTLPAQGGLDALLFQSRSGFCEHFASAFSALMRAAGVPARVVIGYQGGEWIPANRWGRGYLDVRQSDAHAWSEVWLEGRGWVRIDPTAWVAPQRLKHGAPRQHHWFRAIEQAWTRLDLHWSRWVIGFDGDDQQRLLGHWQPWQGWLLLAGLAGGLSPGLWWLLRQGQRRDRRASREEDRHRRLLARRVRQVSRLGIPPEPGETLDSWCGRVAEQHPSLGDSLDALQQGYQALRFSGQGSQEQVRALCRADQNLGRALRRLRQGPLQR